LLLAAALIGSSALAQQTVGTVKGTLSDDSGAVIPAASVSLVGNGTTKTAQSQSDGSYTFVGIPPGQYTVSVTFPGFAPFSKPVTVTGGGTVQVPVQLAVSAEKQEVTVAEHAGTTISVEPDNNATALVIKGEDLMALPDDPDDLSDALQALAGPGAGPNGGQIYIDGFTGGQLPPKESIREIRINQNPFSAEYDRLGFGRIEILTKPGFDKFRGTLSFNDTDSALDSRNPFASNKPNYSVHNFDGSVGGPLSHRASFNFNFNERDVQNNAITNAFLVDPTTFAVSPITTSIVTPNTMRSFSPRVDYQLSTNSTLTVRFEERTNSNTNSGLGGKSLPPPYSNLAYNTSGNNQNVMITETSILNPKVVNETRFQFTRSYSSDAGNQIPSINVAGAFTTGGNGLGGTHDNSRHFELTNVSSVAHSAHTLRFGVRVRREADQSSQPQGFNGSFTFLGGTAPVLGPTNQIVLDANGNPVESFLTSLQSYVQTLQLMQAGLSQTQIEALGRGPSRFSIQGGQSYISMTRFDAAPFVQDDWRVKPNLTLSLGLRYEVQTLVSDYKNIAPRLGVAWAPGNPKNGRQKTVFRGGFGIFYDRISYGMFEQAALNNGHSQVQYTVYNPTFYPNIPALSTLTPGQNLTQVVDPKLRAEYSLQSAIGVERQLPHNTVVSMTYTDNRSNHMPQTVPINTPLPGTFNPLQPLSATNGLFPYGYNAGHINEYESGGVFRQRILMATFNTRFSRRVSLFGNYSLTYAHDLPGSPTDPYDFAVDYGRSNFDQRHNFQLTGSVIGPVGIRLAPFISLRSGSPYDVLLGEDLFGDNGNARPFLASGPGSNIICQSAYGCFNTNLGASAAQNYATSNAVPRNYLTQPGVVSVNMRLYRVFGFGPRRGANAATAGGDMGGGGFGGGPGGGGPGGGGPGGGGGGMRGGGGPGGGGGGGGRGGGGGGGGGMRMGGGGGGGRGGMGGGETTDRRFNMTVGVNVTNVLNHLNPGGYVGTLTSPQFGEPTSVNTGFGGGGFGGRGGGGTANNRRLDMSIRLSF